MYENDSTEQQGRLVEPCLEARTGEPYAPFINTTRFQRSLVRAAFAPYHVYVPSPRINVVPGYRTYCVVSVYLVN